MLVSALNYSDPYYEEYSPLDGKSFSMGNNQYDVGFTMCAQEGCKAIYNLEEKYQLLSGLVGNLDTVNKNAAYSVYSDDAILDTNPYGRCCFTKRIQDRRHQC